MSDLLETKALLQEAFAANPALISYEFFPPKTPDMEKTLWNTIFELASLKPDFFSVTYGAGGSTKDNTFNTITRILAETDTTPSEPEGASASFRAKKER